jgi:hypothetical protein
MTTTCTKAELSPARKKLIRTMQRLNFGRIENLAVSQGEPVFTPPPRMVREVKFGGDNGPRPEAATGDFVLKNEVRDLLAHLDRLGTGTIHSLVVQHGLPVRMSVEENSS